MPAGAISGATLGGGRTHLRHLHRPLPAPGPLDEPSILASQIRPSCSCLQASGSFCFEAVPSWEAELHLSSGFGLRALRLMPLRHQRVSGTSLCPVA